MKIPSNSKLIIIYIVLGILGSVNAEAELNFNDMVETDQFDFIMDVPKGRFSSWSSDKDISMINAKLTIHEGRFSSKWGSIVRFNLRNKSTDQLISLIFSLNKKSKKVEVMHKSADDDNRYLLKDANFELGEEIEFNLVKVGVVLGVELGSGKLIKIGEIDVIDRIQISASGIDAELKDVTLYKRE